MYPQFNQPYYPYQQPQMPPSMPGKLVGDFNEITIKDIPTDGSWAYFAKIDGSEVQARKWSENGSVVNAVYKRQDQPAADPLQDRLATIEERLDKIENARTRKKEVADE